MKKKSSKISKILRFFCIVLFGLTVTAHAVIPVVYWAGMLATAAFTAVVAQATFGNRTRVLNIYAGKSLGYIARGLGESQIASRVYAIPDGSKNGVELELRTDKSALKNQIKNNSTAYPNITDALGASGAGSTGMSAGSWGYGDDYDVSKLPQAGDILTDPNTGKTYRVDSVSGCGSPTACYTSERGGYQVQNGYFRVFGCGTNDNCAASSGATRIYVTQLSSQPPFDWDSVSDEQWDDVMKKNPTEVKQAQQDLYNSLHGRQQNSFPSTSSPAHLVYPGTNQTPVGSEILDTVEKSELTEATTGTAEPNTNEPPPTTTTTTTRTRGEATVTTDPQTGARTVTYPTTITVTDAQGNVISEQTEYFVGTYPAGVALPADVQAAVDGVTESETSTATETGTPALTKPAIAEIDLSAIFTAANILHDKFPFSLLATVTDFLTSWYVEPQTPSFVMEISGIEFEFSLVMLDSFALWWRRFLRFIAMATAAYYAIRICFM